MVVAEIPLWVLHSSGAPDPEPSSRNVDAAEHSLALLLPASHKTKKCAIYSVDVHPDGTKFATAGGDGAVRIWNTACLFPSKNVAGAYFDEKTGTFVSSSDSGSSVDDMSSSESDSGIMNGTTNTLDKGKNLPAEPQIHDLNAVVRRKKGGSTNSVHCAVPSPSKPQQVDSGLHVLPPLEDSTKLRGKNHHRLLCTLSAHTGSSVLCIRFSTTGQYLASAGDDGCVCIYAPQSSTVGNLISDKASVEHWSRIKLCRGHGLDVVDLAWAPDDSHLVSCSLDSATPIIVWKLPEQHPHSGGQGSSSISSNSSSMVCNPYKVLGQTIHTSTVKGVAFDPAGSYLASSGDDPAVCIWRAHDDWGLEARVDASSGIFRKWKSDEEDATALSTQSLFRRISWSTDGAFVCSTNSVVKNKHVVSTIAREGWAVSGGAATVNSSGSANLVGHKQPVVVSRHASQLLNARSSRKSVTSNTNESSAEDNDDTREDLDEDAEPQHATLLALGDRRGFVTVWSTRKTRPIFKLQCSESRCTVTDLSWGLLGNGDLILLVALLDGQIVALRFAVPDEMGALLSKKDKAKVFRLRYGIDTDNGDGMSGQRRLFVGRASGPKLIENVLQMTLEEEQNIVDDVGASEDVVVPSSDHTHVDASVPRLIREQQEESRLNGKKRVRPVLMTAGNPQTVKRYKQPATTQNEESENAKSDPFQNALDVAEKATVAFVDTRKEKFTKERLKTDSANSGNDNSVNEIEQLRDSPAPISLKRTPILAGSLATLPFSTDRVHSSFLPIKKEPVADGLRDGGSYVAECVNSTAGAVGSKVSIVPCVTVSIIEDGRVLWKDQIPGTSCSVVASSHCFILVGTVDGTVQIFGTSPTIGWTSGSAFRSHPPLIFGSPIISLHVKEYNEYCDADPKRLEIVVVAADGSFGVYTLLPGLRLLYKGSVMPAITHMHLGSSLEDRSLPKVSRVQLTDFGQLFLLLSYDSTSHNRETNNRRGHSDASACGVGGSLQAFVYDRPSELWLRISDSRFVLSDFYSSLPSVKSDPSNGVLSAMDDAVRLGALQSSLKISHRGQHTDAIYGHGNASIGNFIASRSHCEDRMACSLALKSSHEFRHWLSQYIKVLAVRGNTSQIRMLVDMLLGKIRESSELDANHEGFGCWWMSAAPAVLSCDRVNLIKAIIIPQLSKNRSLQRITNEIALEVDNL